MKDIFRIYRASRSTRVSIVYKYKWKWYITTKTEGGLVERSEKGVAGVPIGNPERHSAHPADLLVVGHLTNRRRRDPPSSRTDQETKKAHCIFLLLNAYFIPTIYCLAMPVESRESAAAAENQLTKSLKRYNKNNKRLLLSSESTDTFEKESKESGRQTYR